MSVEPYDDTDKFPGALAAITDPPSLAGSGDISFADPGIVGVVTAQQIPALTASPWSNDVPGSDLIITESTGGNTGTFSCGPNVDANTFDTGDGVGDGDPVTWHCTPDGRSGIQDLARRLQNGYTDAGSTARDPIPTTIIGGKIITEANPANPTIAPY